MSEATAGQCSFREGCSRCPHAANACRFNPDSESYLFCATCGKAGHDPEHYRTARKAVPAAAPAAAAAPPPPPRERPTPASRRPTAPHRVQDGDRLAAEIEEVELRLKLLELRRQQEAIRPPSTPQGQREPRAPPAAPQKHRGASSGVNRRSRPPPFDASS